MKCTTLETVARCSPCLSFTPWPRGNAPFVPPDVTSLCQSLLLRLSVTPSCANNHKQRLPLQSATCSWLCARLFCARRPPLRIQSHAPSERYFTIMSRPAWEKKRKERKHHHRSQKHLKGAQGNSQQLIASLAHTHGIL